ncbi:MAG: MvaI/BcnI family restriction endonuclease [Candidatus Thorarchaeota archaeon]
MTSVFEMTVDELKHKVKRIRDLGWIRSYRKGDTGVGHTLEGWLGIGENNVSLPDWGVLEVKTTRRDSNTPITLFAKSPKLVKGTSRKEFMENHGYWDESKRRQALYTTLNAINPNSLGWMMVVDRVARKILFLHYTEVVAFQDTKTLKEKMREKLSNLVLIIADRKSDGRDEYFHYDEAYLLADADIDRLLDLVEAGDITFDWRMHLKSSGVVRDHGPGYRMLENKLPNLYRHRERII